MSKLTKVILIIGAVLIVISVIGMIAAKEPSPVMYIKDGETYLSTYDTPITENMCDDDGIDLGAAYVNYRAVVMGRICGDYIYYVDNTKVGGVWDIYCRSLTDLEAEPIFIDSGITSYQLSGDGETITYCKPGTMLYDVIGDVKLYQRNIHESEAVMIDSVDSKYYVTANDVVFYKNSDFMICKYENGVKTELADNMYMHQVCFNENGVFYTGYSEEHDRYYLAFHDGEKEYTSFMNEYKSEPLLIFADNSNNIYYTLDGSLCRSEATKHGINMTQSMRNTPFDESTYPRIYDQKYAAEHFESFRVRYDPAKVIIYKEQFYYTTVNEDGTKTLQVNTGSENINISENVLSFTVMPDGKAAYLKDYNGETGTLCIYDGKKSEVLEENVEWLIDTYWENITRSFKF